MKFEEIWTGGFSEEKSFKDVDGRTDGRRRGSDQNWAVPDENVSSSICGQRNPRSDCASARSDQGLYCPQTEALDTTECMN